MNKIGDGDILIDVREAAFRLREFPRSVRQALLLLEMRGIAKRTNFRNYWKLRDRLGAESPPNL